VRRDQVALIAFRGVTAELLLPATRSLTRARRCLAELPGGGTTPLAAALLRALGVVEAARRRGETPFAVFLTDGRGNVALDGRPDPAAAQADTEAVARRVRASRAASLLVDTSPRPRPAAEALARLLGARYFALPQAGAGALASLVGSALDG
jgi:magnesium chelatase subunit D